MITCELIHRKKLFLVVMPFGYGVEQDLIPDVMPKGFSAFLNQHHVTHTFRETSGAHTWMVWRRYLNEIAPLLFQPVAAPSPQGLPVR